MNEVSDKRSDTTREQILRAAAHQFAQRPYYAVGLDDILAEAQLTKGAMYFHFRSKHALALAIVDEQTAKSGVAVKELLTRKLSGLETLIDVSYLIAMADITENVTRAAFNLLESVGRTEKLQERLLGAGFSCSGRLPGAGSVRATSSTAATPRTSAGCWSRSTWGCVRPATSTTRSCCSATTRRRCRRFCGESCNRTRSITSGNS